MIAKNSYILNAKDEFTVSFWNDRLLTAPINSRLNVVVRSPTLLGLGRNGCWLSRRSQLPRALPFIFLLCCPLNDRRKAVHSFFKIGHLFSPFLFSCSSLALLYLLILLLFLISGNVHPNPGPIFPCSVCAGNVTWWGKSVQCCTCSKWVHLRCSQLSLSKFRAPGSSHSWSGPPSRNTVTPSSDSSDTYTSTVQSGPPLLMLHSRPTLVSKLLIPHLPILYLLPLPHHYRPLLLAILRRLLPPLLPLTLRVLQWNAGGLRSRSTELLHFLSSHHVNLICIQESNLNSFSSFRIPGFSSLRSDRTHSGLAFSLVMPRTLAAALSLSSGSAYLFLNFPSLLFLRSIPTVIM